MSLENSIIYPVLFKQVRILSADSSSNIAEPFADVFVDSDHQIHLNFDQSQIPQETNIDQRSGVVLGTGLIDLYSTSSEPGHESKETISELVQAAKNGGFATIGILPNTQPAIDDIAELAESVIGFTDSKPISNLLLVRRAMEYIKPLGKHIALFPQNPDLTGTGVIREGKWSLQYGMTGYPAAAETTALAALIELVRLTKAPAHFMRLSTAQSVELIYQAKNDGLPVTASATWLHLCHCDRDLATYDPNLRLSPPLGSEGDRLALIAGIKSGVIDSIAIDHTPCAYEEKVVPFEVAPVGAIGLEFALPVLWQNLVISGLLTATELWQALSVNPAKILGLAPPKLSTLFEPCLEWLAKDSAISSQSRNSNYMGRSIIGKVLA